jgi:protein SCO1/2
MERTSHSAGGKLLRGRRAAIMAAIAFCLAAAGIFWFAERQARQMEFGFGNFQDRAFELVDQTGASRDNADFAGAPIALFFGYTYCPDVCPMTLTLLSTSLDEVAEQGVDTTPLQTVFITVDAERDTPEQLAAYLSLFDMPVTGLTGDRRQLERAHDAFGAYASRVEQADGVILFDHTATVYLYDASGTFFGTVAFNEPPQFVTEKVRRLF